MKGVYQTVCVAYPGLTPSDLSPSAASSAQKQWMTLDPRFIGNVKYQYEVRSPVMTPWGGKHFGELGRS